MKTTTLVIGLVQVAAAVCGLMSAAWIGTLPLVVLFMVAGAVNMIAGTNNVLESLFGDNGLVCEVFGRVEEVDAE